MLIFKRSPVERNLNKDIFLENAVHFNKKLKNRQYDRRVSMYQEQKKLKTWTGHLEGSVFKHVDTGYVYTVLFENQNDAKRWKSLDWRSKPAVHVTVSEVSNDMVSISSGAWIRISSFTEVDKQETDSNSNEWIFHDCLQQQRFPPFRLCRNPNEWIGFNHAGTLVYDDPVSHGRKYVAVKFNASDAQAAWENVVYGTRVRVQVSEVYRSGLNGFWIKADSFETETCSKLLDRLASEPCDEHATFFNVFQTCVLFCLAASFFVCVF